MEITVAQNKYEKEFTYFAAYSLIKQIMAKGTVDKNILKRLNERCAETMACEPIPL